MSVETILAFWPQVVILAGAVGAVIAIVVKMTPTQRDDKIYAKVKKVWAVVTDLMNRLRR